MGTHTLLCENGGSFETQKCNTGVNSPNRDPCKLFSFQNPILIYFFYDEYLFASCTKSSINNFYPPSSIGKWVFFSL